MTTERVERVRTFVADHADAVERGLGEVARRRWGQRFKIRRLDDTPWTIGWVVRPEAAARPAGTCPTCHLHATFDASGKLVRVAARYADRAPDRPCERHTESEQLTEETLRGMLKAVADGDD